MRYTVSPVPLSCPPHANDAAPSAIESGIVSIVIPCYKGSRYLAEAIESCLNQTYRDIEVVVVDDASPDDCHAIAARFAAADPRVRVVRREQNGGVARAFNTGFQLARGQFHTRLAQDDSLSKDAVELMVQRLRAEPDAGLVYADMETMDASGRVQRRVVLPEPEGALIWGNGLGVCVMWRRAVWEKVGEFDPAFDAAEDFDYWVRVAERFAIVKVNRALLRFRVHDSMGSLVHTRRQEAASLAVRRRQIRTHSVLTGTYWGLRRSLSHHYFSFAYDHSASGDRWGALWRIALSFVYYPLPYPRHCVKYSWARLRLSSMIVWRLFRRPTPRAAISPSRLPATP